MAFFPKLCPKDVFAARFQLIFADLCLFARRYSAGRVLDVPQVRSTYFLFSALLRPPRPKA
jgi:hypothetical protein